METISCPLCNQSKTRLLFTRRDLTYRISDVAFNVVRCCKCGLSYVNPRPTIEEISHYYPDDFYRVSLSAEELLANQWPQLRVKLQHIPDLPLGSCLDIGCSRGEFLYLMQTLGWKVKGVEFSSKAINPFGLEIFNGTLDAAQFDSNTFDLVTLWAVLEHIHNPLDQLREISRIMKKDTGTLLLMVTNMNSLPARLMQVDDIPRHLILFHPSSLKRMLSTVGFTDVKIYCDHRLYGSTHRGLFLFLVKMLLGEKANDIVEQRHAADGWQQYTAFANGRRNRWVEKVNLFDNSIFPKVDRIMDRLGWGLNLFAVCRKP